jgi:hypothetical protein
MDHKISLDDLDQAHNHAVAAMNAAQHTIDALESSLRYAKEGFLNTRRLEENLRLQIVEVGSKS